MTPAMRRPEMGCSLWEKAGKIARMRVISRRMLLGREDYNTSMRVFGKLRLRGAILLIFTVLSAAGCKRAFDSSVIGTYKMGETVQAGHLTYHVMEAHWTPEIPNVANRPGDRYLLVRLDVTNKGNSAIAVPGFTLIAPNGKTYAEVTQGVNSAANWLGLLRSVEPNQKLQGVAIFDAPIGGYKLALSDGGEIGTEKNAHVEIPADLG